MKKIISTLVIAVFMLSACSVSSASQVGDNTKNSNDKSESTVDTSDVSADNSSIDNSEDDPHAETKEMLREIFPERTITAMEKDHFLKAFEVAKVMYPDLEIKELYHVEEMNELAIIIGTYPFLETKNEQVIINIYNRRKEMEKRDKESRGYTSSAYPFNEMIAAGVIDENASRLDEDYVLKTVEEAKQMTDKTELEQFSYVYEKIREKQRYCDEVVNSSSVSYVYWLDGDKDSSPDEPNLKLTWWVIDGKLTRLVLYGDNYKRNDELISTSEPLDVSSSMWTE